MDVTALNMFYIQPSLTSMSSRVNEIVCVANMAAKSDLPFVYEA